VSLHPDVEAAASGLTARELVEIAPGAVHLRRWLTTRQQHYIASLCFALGSEAAGFYTPVVRGNHPMSVRMLCLGRHWNARTYRYESLRSDVDGRPAPPLPLELSDLANSIGAEAGFALAADLCIVNWYRAGSRMGLHQDKDEGRESIERGVPVVSLSIGDSAQFLFGGARRRDPVQRILLTSGDAFVFGGPARLRYHGVSRIILGSGPSSLGFEGRLNLTFRQF
jgi:DNA oxidative demethylase